MASVFEDKNFMSIAALKNFSISITPVENSGMYHIDIGSEVRKDVVSMRTADQFGMRIKSMLRSLLNGEIKEVPVVQPDHSSGPEQSKPNKKGA